MYGEPSPKSVVSVTIRNVSDRGAEALVTESLQTLRTAHSE